MLEQLSYESSPQGHEAASSITQNIIRKNNHKTKEIIKMCNKPQDKYPFFNEALKLVVEDPPQFSLAAWYMGGEDDYIKRVIDICYEKCVLKRHRLKKLRGIIRTIALIKRLYDDTLQRYYLPGGKFETNAASIWNPIMKIDGQLGFVKKIKQEVYYNRV